MTRIITPFGFHSTAAEVAEGIDFTGKRVVITGAASGIGRVTALTLAKIGAEVTITARDLEAGRRVVKEIQEQTGNPHVSVAQLELTDRASVAAFVQQWQGPLHVLINNAGIMANPETRTPEGWELQFATNHLGHFALTLSLQSALAAAGNARVVVVSSSAHLYQPVIFDDIHFHYRPYDPGLAYAQSKAANVLFAVEASKRWASDGITVNALMPGAIPTNLQRYVGKMSSPVELRKTQEQGASTSVLLATSPLLEGVGGRYFANNTEQERVPHPTKDFTGVAPFALDPANAARLWELSMEHVGSWVR